MGYSMPSSAAPWLSASGGDRELAQLLQRDRLAAAVEQLAQVAVQLAGVTEVVEQRSGLQAVVHAIAHVPEQHRAEAGMERLRIRVQPFQQAGPRLRAGVRVQP